MLLPREELEEKLKEGIKEVRKKRRTVHDIKKHLVDKYDVLAGTIQLCLNDPSHLKNLDPRVLMLLTEQIYLKTGIQELNPEKYFTEAEIKKSKQYSGKLQLENEIEFPYTIDNVIMIEEDAFVAKLSAQEIAKLLKSRHLNYNFDIQRESVKTQRHGKIIQEAKLVMENVLEIKEHLKNNTLVPTFLVFNAAVRTSDTGDELVYDASKMQLTITKGTRLDIVDGYHRCKACELAVTENPEIDFEFGVLFTNYTDNRAKQYQAQLAKATPISRTRQKELEGSRNADLVVKELKIDSDLKDKISQTHQPRITVGELVSYNILADTIEEQFKMKTRADVYDVADYLKEFFNTLIGTYTDEFVNNVQETRKNSLINENITFIGYIVLARRMFEKGIKARNVIRYIADIDFRKDNPMWEEIGVLVAGNINDNVKKARKVIKEFFENISIEDGEEVKTSDEIIQ
ncbi:DNA sulfur modification protein DndB [Bacillus smithii]|uniref:DNA sulfur modification protein DndB n=1 Tax=Bacillus smithii TaxID=1479 RepID=UPI002E221F14|nr:DNA sulfur modification protein DndB [Bacillus smithii]MED4929144.1 DNA sulfur modification protein DndB [Bacillus smithii]